MNDSVNQVAGAPLVLVVEDSPRIRAYMKIVLQSAGFEVLEAGDGLEALELFDVWHCRIDLVITDIRMPRMLGTELAAWLRSKSPELPLIFVSGEPAPTGAKLGNGWCFLEKPFGPAVLVEAVRELIRTSPASR